MSVAAEGTTQIFRWPCEPINLLIGHCDSPTAEYQDGFISEVRKDLTSRLVAINLEPRLPENFFISRLIRSFEVKVKIGQIVLSSNILINFYIKSLGTKWDIDAETFLYVFERWPRNTRANNIIMCQVHIYYFVWNLFKVNKKENRTTSIALLCCL